MFDVVGSFCSATHNAWVRTRSSNAVSMWYAVMAVRCRNDDGTRCITFGVECNRSIVPGPEYHLPLPLAYSHCSTARAKGNVTSYFEVFGTSEILFKMHTVRQWLAMIQNCTDFIHSAYVIGGGPIIVGGVERLGRPSILGIRHRVIQFESHPS